MKHKDFPTLDRAVHRYEEKPTEENFQQLLRSLGLTAADGRVINVVPETEDLKIGPAGLVLPCMRIGWGRYAFPLFTENAEIPNGASSIIIKLRAALTAILEGEDDSLVLNVRDIYELEPPGNGEAPHCLFRPGVLDSHGAPAGIGVLIRHDELEECMLWGEDHLKDYPDRPERPPEE